MRTRCVLKRFILGWACASCCLAADITIEASRPLAYRIPRTLFGTFLEPIGNSIYGGLWAQILENPSFEDSLWSATNLKAKLDADPALYRASEIGLPLPWKPLEWAGWRYEPRWGDAANSARSLLIMGLPGRQIGIKQPVYLPVHRVRKFDGSIFAKPLSGPAELEVSLRGHNRAESVLARTTIPLTAKNWQRYEYTLELAADKLAPAEEADFVITVRDAGRVLIDQVFLLPADHVHGMNPEMIALSKALRSPVLRYGGNFTSGYHWRDGVGPADKRVSALNQAWGMPEYNHFGTDEFLDFCRLIGAEPQIALNVGSGTPDEAAGWVRYVNDRWNSGKGGLLWELGNELWGDWQIGYPPLSEVRERTVAFSQAIRAADPKARLIATGQDPDKYEEWNAELLKTPAVYDFLATHFVVVPTEVVRRDATPDFVAMSAFAYPVAIEKRLRQMREQIESVDGARGRVKLAFTEWLFYGRDDRGPRFMNQGGAVITGSFLNMLMRTADFVPIADMTGLIEFGGIWQKKARVFGTPAYYAFRMYSTADVAVPVNITVSGTGTYDISGGNRRVPEISAVPYLDVFAARNEQGDKLTLFCVNRDLRRDVAVTLHLPGVEAGSSARVQQLSAPSIYNGNDEAEPEAVIPIESALRVENRQARYTFPRGGITVIEFSIR